MQTLPNGVIVPNADGGEQISATGVAEMRTLGTSVDSALAGKASIAYTDAQMAAARFTKTAPSTGDLDTMKTPGTYSLGSPFPDGWTNVPEGITTASILNVYGSPVQSWCAQELIQYGPNPRRLWRISRTTAAWNPWVQIGGGGDVSSAMGGNAARQSQFVAATGGPVSTGGKAAFALRLDHGWTNIKSKLRAGLIARGIVPGVASCSRQWDLEENSGATIAEVKSWVAAGEFEILNQGATHGQAMVNYVDEIVNGRIELEDQLGTNVWGFAPPGESTDWEDFGGGRVDGWASLPAGIALASHAYSMGYVGGARRVIDGTIRQGLSHITLDTYDMAQARAQVDAAIAERRGIQVMLHPRELDKAGKITTAQFLSFLDYVVGKRDAGDLVILSPGELVRADATLRTPTAHKHPVTDVTGLQAALDGKLRKEPINLGSEDLNTIIDDGPYSQSSSATASAALNYPANSNGLYTGGTLKVTSRAGDALILQEFVSYNGKDSFWRARYLSTWYPWERSAKASELDPVTARVAALEQDTGTRNITALATGMTAGTWTLRRAGKWVFMNLYEAAFTSTGTWQAPSGMIPSGFRPPAVPAYVLFPGAARVSTMSSAGVRISRYGGVDVYDVATKAISVTASWVTDDAWPTTLPGTPA